MVVRDLKKKLDIVHVETDKELKMALSASDLIVNATSIGLKEKDPLPVPGLSFSSSQVCFDVVYHRETEFVSQAKKAGAQASGGLDMLLFSSLLASSCFHLVCSSSRLSRSFASISLSSALLSSNLWEHLGQLTDCIFTGASR
jgi:shikimate 5-dehydrogenase